MDLTPTIESAERADPAEPQLRARWGPWATIAWSIPIGIVMLISQMAGVIAYWRWLRLIHPAQPINILELSTNGGALGFSLTLSTPFVLGFVAFVVRLSRVPIAEYLALKLPRWRDVRLGFALLAAVLVLTGILASVSGQETPAFMTETFESARAAGMLPLLLLAFVVLGPLQEEILFRGFLFRGVAPSLGVWPAIVLTALTWALMHAQYQWFFVGEIFALGLALGWLRARSGSTILTFVLHATVNGLALLEMAFLSPIP
jgi:membrane protease YdiL (CAAX protease family)